MKISKNISGRYFDYLILISCLIVFFASIFVCVMMANILLGAEPSDSGDINGWVQAFASLASLFISAITIIFIFFTFKSSKDALAEQRSINTKQSEYNEESLRVAGALARPWPLVGKVNAVAETIDVQGDGIDGIVISFNVKNYASIPCLETELYVVVIPVGMIENFANIENSTLEGLPTHTEFLGAIGPSEQVTERVYSFMEFSPYGEEDTDRIETMNYQAEPFIIKYSLSFINPANSKEIVERGHLLMTYHGSVIRVSPLNIFDMHNLEYCYT